MMKKMMDSIKQNEILLQRVKLKAMKFLALFFLVAFLNCHARAQDTSLQRANDTIKTIAVDQNNYPPSKWYFKFYSGDGFLTPGSYRFNATYFIHDSVTKIAGRKGLGNGIRFGGGFGVVLNDFLNIGIDAEYQSRSWAENSSSSKTDDSNYDNTSTHIKYQTLSIAPNVIFKALARPKFFVYNKLGILFMLPYVLTGTTNANHYVYQKDNVEQTVFYEGNSSINEQQYKISLGIGLNAAIGISFRVNSHMRAFGELSGNYIALSPSSSQLVSYSTNNVSLNFNTSSTSQSVVIKQISTVTTNTAYKSGGSFSLNGTYESDPINTNAGGYTVTNTRISNVLPRFTINMAVLGINTGIIYRF
jgi:hypothetical protein